jgi:hypothetical protein
LGFSGTLLSIIVGMPGGDGDLVTFEIYCNVPSVLFMLISFGFFITLALRRPKGFGFYVIRLVSFPSLFY